MATFTKKKKKMLGRARLLSIRLFAGILGVGCLLGLMIFARPKISEKENRTLNTFPEFTVASFLDGSWFSGISLWYSDTFPFRDSLIAADQTLKGLYGFEPSTTVIGDGGAEGGDELPDQIPTDKDGEGTEAGTEVGTEAGTEKGTEAGSEAGSVGSETPVESEVAEISEPDSKKMESAIQKQLQSGLYVENGAAYTIYKFSKKACTTYTDAINRVADELKGKTNVYSILIANQSGIMLPKETQDKLGCTDQGQAIDYYYSLYNKNVHSVPTTQTLLDHNDEYLFFRSDHHWTADGAYYVYESLCKTKGIQAHDRSQFEKKEFTDFLGTFYAKTNNSQMKKNPDTVNAYIPMGTNDMIFYDKDGQKVKWNVVKDVTKWKSNSKYNCFIGSDEPLAIIENPNISDGSSCLVLKESYGNAFTPFLVDHYQTVYVMDFRYTKHNVKKYLVDNNIQDLIVINNISIIASTSVAETISGLLK